MSLEYLNLLLFLILSFSLSIIIVLGTMLLVPRITDIEKVSAYECGFHPFSDTRSKFDVRFYLVSILFIIFDLEITFLFPWSLVLGNLGSMGYYSMMVFLWLLIIGFFYEWKKGALDWE
jgi:NADH-quinone oxidoreductase subunit A